MDLRLSQPCRPDKKFWFGQYSILYSLQYVGVPAVWSSQLVGDNTSVASENAVAYANGVAYWMGVDKFYKYDGRTQTQNCDLRQYVFEKHK
jgi:hypothetical protein